VTQSFGVEEPVAVAVDYDRRRSFPAELGNV